MANKGSNSLAVDKECLESFYQYSAAFAKLLDQKVNEFASPISYLKSDENVTGAGVEDFVKNVETIESMVGTADKRFQNLAMAAKTIADQAGCVINKMAADLNTAKADFTKKKMLLQQAQNQG